MKPYRRIIALVAVVGAMLMLMPWAFYISCHLSQWYRELGILIVILCGSYLAIFVVLMYLAVANAVLTAPTKANGEQD